MFGGYFNSKVEPLLYSMLTICLLLSVVPATLAPISFNVSYKNGIPQAATPPVLTAAADSPALNLTTSPQDLIANATAYKSSKLAGNLDFPPASYIGYGLDMTSTMIFDSKSVCRSTAHCTPHGTHVNVILD